MSVSAEIAFTKINYIAAVTVDIVSNVICLSSFVTFECFGGNYMFATLIICTAETCIACSSFFGVSGGIKSLRFLFRRNVSLGFSLKNDAILVFVCSRCQCLFIIELISRRFLLKVVVKCTCWLIFFSFSFRSSFRSMVLALISCF